MLSARHFHGAEGPPDCCVPPKRTGALLDEIVRCPVAWPADSGSVATLKQQEAGEHQRTSGLQVARLAPGPGADHPHP
jgi:hypothetical protein